MAHEKIPSASAVCFLRLDPHDDVLLSAPNAEEDPNADAAYKRAHRTEMYRKAQSSEPSIQQ
ncbi:hypothetical protein H9L05_15375 [Hymenobacter qilianensis]|uniref:Uncharacterized protein n=1 Tax=Hymenobacter qilianensis TaxID=1385715 RepID=A0A7H0GSY4_9BACT|nr:hypothetical protein [Hymenobacter qilianensis]QNP51400.1 hypothetical protein H9L05_15375 [Hymenobacter qilianensis]